MTAGHFRQCQGEENHVEDTIRPGHVLENEWQVYLLAWLNALDIDHSVTCLGVA